MVRYDDIHSFPLPESCFFLVFLLKLSKFVYFGLPEV
jgi:hypothetical protein